MSKIIILKGLPASGKSTWAKEQVVKSHGKMKRVNKDDLRAMIDCGGKWSGDKEKFVLKVRDAIIQEAMEKGLDILVDDTNLAPKHVSTISQIVEKFNNLNLSNYEVEVNDSFLQIPYKECVRRDLIRPNSVGEKVIRQMYIQYVLKVEKINQDENLPHVVICDLDGTLALFGKKNPYERDFENDQLNIPVANVLAYYNESLETMNTNVVFLSGRDEKYKNVTTAWLNTKLKTDIIRYQLHMRKEGDSRSDMIVKKELFDEHVKDKYYVDFVIDDRKQICDLWYQMGLFVFSVNQTDEEF